MTSASQWRMSLAHTLTQEYATLPQVIAAFVGGSTARQQADRFSDLELCYIWTTAPSEQDRADAIARVGGDLHRLYPYDHQEQLWEDMFFIGRDQDNTPKSGCQVEVGHYLRETLERYIDRVLQHYDTDEGLHNLMAGIRDGVPLLNAPLLERWQARLRQYPDALRMAVVQRHGIIDHFWRWEMYVARGNNQMELAALMTSVLHEVLHLLLGLNRVYYGGFKWLDAVVDRLPLAPPDLSERIRRVYALPPGEAAEEVRCLVDQTFSLIEEHVPGVDVPRLRQVFYYRRPQWEESPPLGILPSPLDAP